MIINIIIDIIIIIVNIFILQLGVHYPYALINVMYILSYITWYLDGCLHKQ